MAGPVRMCRVCRLRRPQAELRRWTWAGGRLTADTAGRRPGRGLYACPEHAEAEVIKKLGR